MTEAPAKGQWRTVFYKRQFVGVYHAAWSGGVGSTFRSRVVVPYDGTKVRVVLSSLREAETVVSKITLARGKEGAEAGVIEGAPIPVTFKGEAGISLPALSNNVASDVITAPIKKGVWYLQQSYSSEKMSNSYDLDGFFRQPGDQHGTPKLEKFSGGGVLPGNVYRIDVFTEDTRPAILCYGDSITQGYAATPNGGGSYPEVLSRLAGRPVLNLGVSADFFKQAGMLPQRAKEIRGVDTVILLMGINDIFQNGFRTVEDYTAVAKPIIAGVKQNGQKMYIGTILPAKGQAAFDKRPAKEELRQAINAWIREKSRADGVIDFDAAMTDPANPGHMKAELQSDWVHPNDAGYRKMAETAAKFFPAAP